MTDLEPAVEHVLDPRKGLLVDIYHGPGGMDCSAGGVSAHYSRVVLVGEGVWGSFSETAARPAVELRMREIVFFFDKRPYVVAVPVKRGVGTGPMFGGCFIWSSDGRFTDAVRELTGSDAQVGPIPLHDRWEK